jgi:hypothetical protein
MTANTHSASIPAAARAVSWASSSWPVVPSAGVAEGCRLTDDCLAAEGQRGFETRGVEMRHRGGAGGCLVSLERDGPASIAAAPEKQVALPF